MPRRAVPFLLACVHRGGSVSSLVVVAFIPCQGIYAAASTYIMCYMCVLLCANIYWHVHARTEGMNAQGFLYAVWHFVGVCACDDTVFILNIEDDDDAGESTSQYQVSTNDIKWSEWGVGMPYYKCHFVYKVHIRKFVKTTLTIIIQASNKYSLRTWKYN